MITPLVDASALLEKLLTWLGMDPRGAEGLADLLRAEVHARGAAPRAATFDRLQSLLDPALEVTRGSIEECCDALLREGDLLLAPGGLLAATPLRAVPLPAGRARLFGSFPTPFLAFHLGTDITRSGATRACAWSTTLEAAVESLGGLVVLPEAWAGLDQAPCANAEFIARLDERLAWEPRAAGSLERDGPLDWRGWDLTASPPRWRHHAPAPRLWTARTPWAGHRRAWTGLDGDPSTHPFVELSFDDADRARFALCRAAGVAPGITVQRSEGQVILEVPAWLPRPEYRWLSLHAEATGEGIGGTRWRARAEEVEVILAMLCERLGLEPEKEPE